MRNSIVNQVGLLDFGPNLELLEKVLDCNKATRTSRQAKSWKKKSKNTESLEKHGGSS